MSVKERTFATALWDFFCSLKLTIVVLILLAVTSIIGTVVQQNLSPQEYLQEYSETTYRILDSLQFFDMYHSWWFLGLLALFSINLIACSIKRFPRVWKTVNEPVLVADDALFRTFSNVEEVVTDVSLTEVGEKVRQFLGKNFAPPVVTEKEGTTHFFAQKGTYSRFGVYVTHLSILIIFVGAIIGTLWGYKAYVNIVEGTQVNKIWPRGENQPLQLDFAVRCEDFSVSYYEGTMRPKEFRSILTIVDPNAADQAAVPKDRPIIVNDPLTYKGITFYQSSYGPAGDPVFRFRVKVRETGETVEVQARQGQAVAIPGGATFKVVRFAEGDPRFGAGAQVEIQMPDGSRRFANIFKSFPDFDNLRGGAYILTLLDFQQRYYTGLQVAKDPGVWVVWLGCTLLVVGSLVAFFLSHRRIWVTVQPVGDRTGIKIGGSAHRNQPAFEIFFEELKQKLHAEFGA